MRLAAKFHFASREIHAFEHIHTAHAKIIVRLLFDPMESGCQVQLDDKIMMENG